MGSNPTLSAKHTDPGLRAGVRRVPQDPTGARLAWGNAGGTACERSGSIVTIRWSVLHFRYGYDSLSDDR